jgi:hypothetical protein
VKEHEEVEVQAFSCFPWTHPDKLISLRDGKGHEHIFIEDLEHLSNEARTLLKEELRKQYFVPRILTIFTLAEEKELFVWHVNTNAGPRSFLTNRREQFRTIMNGSVIIRDICNDIYMVQNPQSLDSKSLKLLWVYLD